jgi:hypothetical protein
MRFVYLKDRASRRKYFARRGLVVRDLRSEPFAEDPWAEEKRMVKCLVRQAFISGALVLGLGGCASLGNDVQQSNTLVTAVTALTQAESDLYDQIIAVSAARQRIAFERAFVTKDREASATAALYLATPPEGYEKAKAIRLQLLEQLGNYAQQINAIATSASTGWPASQATATVTDTGKLVTTLFGGSVPGYVTKTTDVINALGTSIVASKSASEIQTLAASAEPIIENVQTIITGDSDLINIGIVNGLIPAQQIDEREIVVRLYAEPGGPLARLKLAQSLSTTLPPLTTLLNRQQLVNDAIKKIVGANQALAMKQNKSALQLIDEAVGIAKTATTPAAQTPSTK